ncbi:phospholipid phosphatase 1-like [Ischnura elegans]|uniref:phospholipid phosphatase 1-like n=1 Tax=Ischnura elegans TaxID=197161 RepID=UPI001ED87F42|nr:phospholipid phosphatase 1-like [Ischnura elegans]
MRSRRRVAVEVATIAVVGMVALSLNLFASPFHRGFFCGDASIRLPYRAATISEGTLLITAVLVPSFIMVVAEMAMAYRGSPSIPSGSTRGSVAASSSYCVLAPFWLGGVSLQLGLEAAKFTSGRLRPHFIDVCIPDVECPPGEPLRYIEHYGCRGTDEDLIREARLSFPSAHSALAFYSMAYLSYYLQCRIPRLWLFPRAGLQAFLFLAAALTAISRVSDNMHHWSDAAFGSAAGFLWCLIFVLFCVMEDYESPLKRRKVVANGCLTCTVDNGKKVYAPCVRSDCCGNQMPSVTNDNEIC